MPVLNSSAITHNRNISLENHNILSNKIKGGIINGTQNHKRTKSVNPNSKFKNNFISTPKKTNVKKLTKTNGNKSPSYNKQLDSSMAYNYESNNPNSTFLQNIQHQNAQNENNTIKTTKMKTNSIEKKITREPRNPLTNKNKPLYGNLRKESSNERKGKFLV